MYLHASPNVVAGEEGALVAKHLVCWVTYNLYDGHDEEFQRTHSSNNGSVWYQDGCAAIKAPEDRLLGYFHVSVECFGCDGCPEIVPQYVVLYD